MSKLTKDKLDAYKKPTEIDGDWINVGMSTCGIAAGADEVYELLKDEVQNRKLNIAVRKCGCAGKCYAEPLVEISVKGLPIVTYGKVDKATALAIIDKHIIHKELLNGHIYDMRKN